MAYTILVVLITLAVVTNVRSDGYSYVAGTGLIVLGFLVLLLH